MEGDPYYIPFIYDDEAICEVCKRVGAIKWLDGRYLCVACFADEQRKKAPPGEGA